MLKHGLLRSINRKLSRKHKQLTSSRMSVLVHATNYIFVLLYVIGNAFLLNGTQYAMLKKSHTQYASSKWRSTKYAGGRRSRTLCTRVNLLWKDEAEIHFFILWKFYPARCIVFNFAPHRSLHKIPIEEMFKDTMLQSIYRVKFKGTLTKWHIQKKNT